MGQVSNEENKEDNQREDDMRTSSVAKSKRIPLPLLHPKSEKLLCYNNNNITAMIHSFNVVYIL